MPRWTKRANARFDGECTLCGWAGDGLDARIRRPHRSLRDASRNIVVVATRQG